jgi:hypothetical protein
MKRFAGISILLNVALLVVWWRTGHVVVDEAVPASVSRATITRIITNVVEVVVTNTTPVPIFHWSVVESESFEEYRANLRRLDCPEWLVKEIIIAELMAYYDSREAELQRNRPAPYWATRRERFREERKFEEERWNLAREEHEVMKQLTGLYREEEGDDVIWESAKIFVLFHGFGYEQSWNLVSELVLQDHHKRMVEKTRLGFLTPADVGQLRMAYHQMKASGAALVTPALFEEFWLRLQTILGSLTSDFELPGMQLSGGQLRELIRIRSSIIDPVEREFVYEDEPDGRELNELNKRVAEKLAIALGQQLADDYGRSQNPAFKRIHDFTKGQQLPVDTAIAVFDVRETAINQVRNLITDPGYDDVTKQELRQLIQLEIERTLENTLGSAIYPTYRETEGAWVDRVGGTVPAGDEGGRR